jgi:hypothetical protein
VFGKLAIRLIWPSVVFLLAIHNSIAAEIVRQAGGPSRKDVIILFGVILPEDRAKFVSTAAVSDEAVVVLNSQGGSTLASIEMGKAIRLRDFGTAVPENALCASACALMWLAGNPRFIGHGAHIGFHASYIDRNGTLLESGVANALVGAYLNQIGLSQRAIAFVTSAPPEGMEWLDAGKARSIGVDVVWMEAENRPQNQPSPGTGTSNERYDPVSAVTRFYTALGAADGNTAAALVVPEKRGIGPFNELNMAKFFGNMKEPLQLRSVRQLNSNLVLAEYHYVYASGRVCNTTAEVSTTYAFGKTLIQGIKAGC